MTRIDLHTRLATLADQDTVAALFDAYRQFYQQPSDIALNTRFIHDRLARRDSVILLAESSEGQALGFCQLYPTFCSVEALPIQVLSDLFVAPTGRRRGAGRALLQAAERHASRNGIARLDLTTAKTNRAAQALYESLGWVRDDIFFTYNRRVAN